jgi:hypothetical protein
MCEDREVILPEEQTKIIEWAEQNFHKFNTHNEIYNYNYNMLYINKILEEFKNDEIHTIMNNIRDRIMEKENLQNIDRCSFLNDFLYVMVPGTRLHYHSDSNNHVSNTEKQQGVHVRFNVCVQKSEHGGRPIYAGKTIDIKERNYIICRAGIDYHGSEWVIGNKNKISLSFGFVVNNDLLHLYTNRDKYVVNDNLIKSWAFNKYEGLIDCVNDIDKTKKYRFDMTKSSNSLENIFTIV